MKKILFLCVHNAARSQMAEAFLNQYGGEEFAAESAGFEPTELNPVVIDVMKEAGIDLSAKKTQSVNDVFQSGRFFGYIVTVCDRAREAECPIFPGVSKKLHWNLEDPEDYTGTAEEIRAKTAALRDRIKEKVLTFIEENK